MQKLPFPFVYGKSLEDWRFEGLTKTRAKLAKQKLKLGIFL